MKYFSYAALFILALLLLVPLMWMVMTSFQPGLGLIVMPPRLKNSTLANYRELFQFPILKWTLNSIVVTAAQISLSLLVSLMAAYGFTFKPFKGSEVLFWLMLASLMIPGEITLIPRFLIIKSFGLFNTLPAIFLPGLGGIVGIFFFRQFLKNFPRELLAMADIDGCGEIRKFIHLVVPLSAPGLAAMVIVAFPGVWKQFLWPLIVTSKTLVRTLPIGLYIDITKASEKYTPESYGLPMAGAVYSFLPIMVVFLVFQKYFTKGLFSGSLKE